jgi:hypothetical protein
MENIMTSNTRAFGLILPAAVPDWARGLPLVEVHTRSSNTGLVTIGQQTFAPGAAAACGGDVAVETVTGTSGDSATLVVRL